MSDADNDPPPGSRLDREQKTIMRVYAALTASMILGLVPSVYMAGIALILFMAVLPMAGAARRKADPAGLTANHMTYIIRTVWILTGLAAVTITAASIYLLKYSGYDPSPLQPCVDKAMAASQAGQSVNSLMMTPCMANFFATNKRAFLTGAAISGVPVTIYLIWRLTRGIDRARKGYRIADVKNWF